MTKDEEYRENAARSVDLAQRATSMADKGHMLRLAEAWLDLADRARQRIHQRARRVREHPLLRDRLGRNQPDV